uniref:Ig-like domain-containing protein n=1 Tax=Ciona savignyi TaxID=51511 RepID=H2Z5T9_CIOSA
MNYALEEYDDFNETSEDLSTITCLIWNFDTSKMMLNVSSSLYDIDLYAYQDFIVHRNQTNYLVQFFAVDRTCHEVIYNFNVINLPNQSCNEYLKSAAKSISFAYFGQLEQLYCSVDSGYPVPANMSTTWFRNCSAIGDGSFQTTSPDTLDVLYIPRIKYEDAGEYTCAATYNGRTMFVATYDIIVKALVHTGKLNIGVRCEHDSISTNLHQDVTIKCIVNLVFGSISEADITIRWNHKKSDDKRRTLCINAFSGSSNSTTRSGISCLYDIHIPTEEEPVTIEPVLKIRSKIVGFSIAFGSYFCLLGLMLIIVVECELEYSVRYI